MRDGVVLYTWSISHHVAWLAYKWKFPNILENSHVSSVIEYLLCFHFSWLNGYECMLVACGVTPSIEFIPPPFWSLLTFAFELKSCSMFLLYQLLDVYKIIIFFSLDRSTFCVLFILLCLTLFHLNIDWGIVSAVRSVVSLMVPFLYTLWPTTSVSSE